MSRNRCKQSAEPVDHPDGGWGWVVVGATFVSAALTYGPSVAYPLFFLPLMQEFEIGLGEVTWLTGSYEFGKAIGYLSTPALIAKFGHRGAAMVISFSSGLSLSAACLGPIPVVVYLLAGVIPGICMGVFGTIFYVMVMRYFAKKRLLAIGLTQTGSALGTLALSPLLQYFIDLYGWRGGMLLLGGLTLNCAVASSLYRPIYLKTDKQETDEPACRTLFASAKMILVIPKFWLVVVISITVFSGWRAYLRFLIPYAQVLDIDPMMSSTILSIYSIVSMFSRVGFGALGDRKGVNVVWLLVATELLTALISSLAWFVDDYAGLVCNSVAHSVTTGTIHTMYVPVIVKAVGEGNFTWGMTLTGFIYSVLGSGIVPLVGTLVDATGEIRLAFIASSILLTVAAAMHIPLLFLNTQHKAKNPKCTESVENVHSSENPICE